jgi:leader peptidase (prepilin peptidase)/N-methyltransferase
MMAYYWLFCVFLGGAVVGSFLNVCIARLPLEKSVLWPGSRCGSCLETIRWYDNLPLVSYLWLGGRCRMCGATFSSRYFIVELATALGFTGLFYVEVVCNIHHFPMRGRDFAIAQGFFPVEWWMVWLHHVLLFSFLMGASVCDLAGREIPLPLTLTGTFVGLVGAVCMPWPWPWLMNEQPLPKIQANIQEAMAWQIPGGGLKQGAYSWPFWGPLPAGFPPGDWKTGLATGIIGILVGTLMMRGVALVFKKGLGREALGLGDADLMMMAGAFLGWQLVVAAFFLSVIPAMVFGLVQMAIKRDNELPFGPSLAAGILVTFLGWGWIGPQVQILFFWGQLLACMVVAGAMFMLFSSYGIRIIRGSQPR